MGLRTTFRIGFNFGLLITLLFFPWWAFVGVLIAMACAVPRAYEVIIFGFFADVVYGNPAYGSTHFFGIFFGTALFLIGIGIRHILQVHDV